MELKPLFGNIADAIREKDGTEDPIVASTFPERIRGIPAGGVALESIAITAPPVKTSYVVGEAFDPAGMMVTATYSNGATLTATGYAVEPSGALVDGVTEVTVRYTEGGHSVTAVQPITVIPRLVSISVTTPPTKTEYRCGETFHPTGMVVTAAYSDGSTQEVDGFTVPDAVLAVPGEQEVLIEYTEYGVTVSTTVPVSVARIAIGAVPSQSKIPTYTGDALTPEWDDYDPEQLILSGTVSAVDAGSYVATFTPTASYEWPDGSIEAKTVTWTIGMAPGSLSLDPAELTLSPASPAGMIHVTRAGSGAVSAVSSDTSVATVTVSETGDITVSSVGQTSGSAVVTVTVGEDSNHLAVTGTCQVTAAFVSPTLNENSWEAIGRASTNGDAPNLWSVGDRKSVTINGTVGTLTLSNLTVYAFILGFNHNEVLEGSGRTHFQIGKTAATGGTDIALCDGGYNSIAVKYGFHMNTTNTNIGGWAGCYMRETICPAFENVIPSDLCSNLKAVTKYTDNVGGKSSTAANITATEEKFFLLSEYEVCGDTSYANPYEANKQAQYSYYSAGNSIIKYRHDAQATAILQWLRSPLRGNSSDFVRINHAGLINYQSAHYSFGFAPCFCV